MFTDSGFRDILDSLVKCVSQRGDCRLTVACGWQSLSIIILSYPIMIPSPRISWPVYLSAGVSWVFHNFPSLLLPLYKLLETYWYKYVYIYKMHEADEVKRCIYCLCTADPCLLFSLCADMAPLLLWLVIPAAAICLVVFLLSLLFYCCRKRAEKYVKPFCLFKMLAQFVTLARGVRFTSLFCSSQTCPEEKPSCVPWRPGDLSGPDTALH